MLTMVLISMSASAFADKSTVDSSLITEDTLKTLIISAIKEKMAAEQQDIATITPPRLSPVRNHKRAHLSVMVTGEARGGRIPVELRLEDKGVLLRRQRVFVSVDFFTPAWTLKRDLPAGYTLSLDDLHEGKVPSKSLKRGSITQPEQVIGSKLKRSGKANSSLVKTDLIIPKLVKRRSIVQLIFNRGGIKITSEGESLGDGQRGDRVKVRNLDSKKIVTGRVIGVNQVDVGR